MISTGAIAEGLPDDVALVAREVIGGVLAACDAGEAVRWHWPDALDDAPRVRVLAFGKASGPMAKAAFRRLGDRVSEAVVLTPPEWAGRVTHPRAKVFAVDHPVPTERNVAAARAVASCALETPADEPVLVLISGGGSAHLTLPRKGITLGDVRMVTDRLLRAGAPIGDLNTVRRAMEQLKGGGLRAVCPSGRVFALVVSDVIGDDLGTIASGPLVQRSGGAGGAGDALGVLTAWGVDVSGSVRAAMASARAECERAGASHRIVASGRGALDAAVKAGFGLSLVPDGFDAAVTGEAAVAGRTLAARLGGLAGEANAVFAWGETTVTVGDASGTGGRNLELALAAAAAMAPGGRWGVLTFATDGVDGPTDAAGAVLCSEMFADGRAATLAENALAKHDSYHAVEMLGGLIRTGPTGTNVNDVAVLWRR